MIKTTQFILLLSTVLIGACELSEEEKVTCEDQSDCIDGFVCTNNVCAIAGGDPDDDDDGIVIGGPGPGPNEVEQFGTPGPFTIASSGAAAINYDTLVGATSVAGGLGCALLSDQSASPGGAASLVYANINSDTGDTRCPDGVFSIRNEPEACADQWDGSIRDGCAVYKEWDSSGTPSVYRLATGGYVSSQSVYRSEMDRGCNIEMSLTFEGGVNVSDSFSFDYNPFAPTAAFCAQ